jgi:diaminopimelate decarboxylase
VDPFRYIDSELAADGVNLHQVAEAHGTPSFVYSRSAIESQWKALDRALESVDHLVCYALKANGNLAILDALARLGSGFDIVSAGELERVRAVSGNMRSTVFSGVGKQAHEMRLALEAGVLCFNVESAEELEVLAGVAASIGKIAPVSLRVNPDVDAKTHPYISTGLNDNKFGIPVADALQLYHKAAGLPSLKVTGIDCHIGSQLTDISPMLTALECLLGMTQQLRDDGIVLEHLDIGGGMGIAYEPASDTDERSTPEMFAKAVAERVAGHDLKLIIEPGRSIVGEAGVLLTKVLYRKHNGSKAFLVVDAAMTELIRPALYQGWHEVVPLHAGTSDQDQLWDIVGPVCESADFLALDRPVQAAQGDVLAIKNCGAYSFVMSSNYNTRPRVAEILLDEGRMHLARKRELIPEMFANENRLPSDWIEKP